MVLFNYSTKEITAKVVYYGPGLCGKTTNLQFIYDNLPGNIQRGRMLSLATKTDRTLFFDFLPIDLGTIRGMRTRVQLYTVPGQVFYNSTRKLVLKGADGVVFVADSQEKIKDANLESFRNLEENCIENGIDLAETPLVLQFNKRDLPGVASLEEMNTLLNKYNAPFYESVATTGIGVHETLKAVTKLVLHSLRAKYAGSEKETRKSSLATPMASPAPPAPAAEVPLVLEEESVAASVVPDVMPPPPDGEPQQPASPLALSGGGRVSDEGIGIVDDASPSGVLEIDDVEPLPLSESSEDADPFAESPHPTGGTLDLESVFDVEDADEPEIVELDLEEDEAIEEQPIAGLVPPTAVDQPTPLGSIPLAPFPDPAPEEPVVEGLFSLADSEGAGTQEESFADLASQLNSPPAEQEPRRAPVATAIGFEDDPLGLGGDVTARDALSTITVRSGLEEVEIPLEIEAGGGVERYLLRLRISLKREE